MRSGRFLRFEQLCLLKKKKKSISSGNNLDGDVVPSSGGRGSCKFSLLYISFFPVIYSFSQQILNEDLLYIRFCVRDEQTKDSFISKNLTRVEDRKPKY